MINHLDEIETVLFKENEKHTAKCRQVCSKHDFRILVFAF
jgi:hypothetical protein